MTKSVVEPAHLSLAYPQAAKPVSWEKIYKEKTTCGQPPFRWRYRYSGR